MGYHASIPSENVDHKRLGLLSGQYARQMCHAVDRPADEMLPIYTPSNTGGYRTTPWTPSNAPGTSERIMNDSSETGKEA